MNAQNHVSENLSPDVVAAIMAALLFMDNARVDLKKVRVREVWPRESAWRWIGW